MKLGRTFESCAGQRTVCCELICALGAVPISLLPNRFPSLVTPKNAHTNFYSIPWKTTDLFSQTIFASIHVPGTFNAKA